ncbi:Transposon Ty3-G Gag-Pol polyprotein [Trichinella nelsoni]|uniref:RNA-directed DNA polymerase n=1 Tax=Trichinella nelsoni TaxID=6336 RepID=A0A0V0SAP5_9BILA|nr:Transposon Ty3-G Gag-Pol polyprotein [Trichinella nelsoni]
MIPWTRWQGPSGSAHLTWHPECDREKNAFSTPLRLFHFRVMPFGLCCNCRHYLRCPATFQRLMETALRGLTWKTCLVYLDDIIVFGRTEEEHLERLEELEVKPWKCQLMSRSVRYLGHIVTQHGIGTDPDETAAVQQWPVPRCVREVRQFLGLASYYRRFVRNFAGVANPLHALTKKGEKWHWDQKEEEVFNFLKRALVSPPILAHPNFDRPFLLDVNASEDAIGAVLSQQDERGPPGVIAYASRSLSRAERSYCATRREMLALVWATRHFRPYLYGRWVRNFREPEGQVARWLEKLAEFDFEVVHRPGKKHQNADALSRRACRECGSGDDSSDIQVAGTLESVSPVGRWQKKGAELMQVREWIEEKWPQLASEGSLWMKSLWSQRGRIVLQEGIVCRTWEIPDTVESRLLPVIPRRNITEILTAIHNQPTGGHLGVAKTLAKVRQRYYWPQQREDAEYWCRACQTCAARAIPTRKLQAPMQLQPVSHPFQRVAMDLVGPLETTRSGNRYTLVVCDYFSKWPDAFNLPNAEARTVATALGRNFESELVKEVCQLFGVTKARATAYHPQSDGLVERMNRTLLDMLAKAPIDHPKDWDAHLVRVLLAYLTSVQCTTGATPSLVVFGRELWLPVDLIHGLSTDAQGRSAGEYVQHLRGDLEQVYEMVRKKAGWAGKARTPKCLER